MNRGREWMAGDGRGDTTRLPGENGMWENGSGASGLGWIWEKRLLRERKARD